MKNPHLDLSKDRRYNATSFRPTNRLYQTLTMSQMAAPIIPVIDVCQLKPSYFSWWANQVYYRNVSRISRPHRMTTK
jgi:hypothetical protein